MRLLLNPSAKHGLLLLALISLPSDSSAQQSPGLSVPRDQQSVVSPSRTIPDDFDNYFQGREEFINSVYSLGPNAIVFTDHGYYFWDHATDTLTPRDDLHPHDLYAKDSRLWFFNDETVYTVNADGQVSIVCNVNAHISGIYWYDDRLIVVAENGVYVHAEGSTTLVINPHDDDQPRKATSRNKTAHPVDSQVVGFSRDRGKYHEFVSHGADLYLIYDYSIYKYTGIGQFSQIPFPKLKIIKVYATIISLYLETSDAIYSY
jgi:hypothetical protein